MARMPNLNKLSYTQLVEMKAKIDILMGQKQADHKAALKQKLSEMAKAQGFDLDEIIGRNGRKQTVAIKYRDPENPANTWTGRGRMPLWMVAHTRKRGVKKEDFLI